jgi:nucleoside-diphosphate-sugar epimerase
VTSTGWSDVARRSASHFVDVALAEVPATGIFNVSAEAFPTRRIVAAIESEPGRRAPKWHIPLRVAHLVAGTATAAGGAGPAATLDRWLADDAYLAHCFKSIFRFEPRIDLEAGLQREVAWYRANEPSIARAVCPLSRRIGRQARQDPLHPI